MPRLPRALLFGLLFVPALAAAQPPVSGSEVLSHEFAEHTVYIVLTPLEGKTALMEVWRRQDGRCAMYPSVVELTSAGLQFSSGRAWEISEVEDGAQITFPSGTRVTYRSASEDPQQLCLGSHDI